MYADGGGLYVQVGPTGTTSWIYRYLSGDRERYMGLGPLHTVTLAEAREAARECRKQRLARVDPIEARRAAVDVERVAAAKTITFREAAEAYIKAHRDGWKNSRHAAQWPTTLEAYVYPVLGKLPVAAIDATLVAKVLTPIWSEKPETASRVRGRIESILGYATVHGYRTGDNPARWRGHLANLFPKKSKVAPVEHHPALPYSEIGAFTAGLRAQHGVAARALEFVILTAARTGEVLGARWAEFDLEHRLWTIPAERMKAEKEHRVPLSGAAMTIVNVMAGIRSSEFVFPGAKEGRPLSDMTLLMLLRRFGRKDLTVHGFRSTFRDWAAERSTFPHEVAEMALAHAVGSKVEAAYRRSDLFSKRRQLAEAWAKFCGVVPSPAENGDKIVQSSARK